MINEKTKTSYPTAIRAVALALVLTFFAQDLSWAVIDLSGRARIDTASFAIPQDIGIVKEAVQGTPDRLIVNIKDIHDNYGAQDSIVGILENLVMNYDVSTIGVEGKIGRASCRERV